MVLRFDRGRLAKAAKSGSGGYIVPATVSRSGCQTYYVDGKPVVEYRPPSEVTASLASLRSAPVTVGHPASMVTPSNWGDLSVGQPTQVLDELVDVEDSPEKWAAADLAIQKQTAIDLLEAGDPSVSEISLGYTCDLEASPGVSPGGEKYDLIQRRIQVNHIALVPQARAGKHARLRLDSESNQILTGATQLKTIKIDGVDYEVGSDAHIQVLNKRADSADARATAAEAASADNTKALATAEARADTAEAKVKTLEAQLVSDARVNEVIAFRESARKVLGAEHKFDGESQHKTRLAILDKLGATLTEAKRKDEAFIQVYTEARLDNLGEDYNDDASTKKLNKDDEADPFEAINKARADAFSKGRS